MKDDTQQTQVKVCDTCAYRRGKAGDWAECARTGHLCSTERAFAHTETAQCDVNFSGWVEMPPKPKARSLRKWLYDLLIA